MNSKWNATCPDTPFHPPLEYLTFLSWRLKLLQARQLFNQTCGLLVKSKQSFKIAILKSVIKGIVVYTLLTGLPAFYGPNWKVEYDAICKGEFTWPENTPISDLAKNFVNQLILLDPLQRLTLKAAFEHPWITNPNPSTVWLEAEKEFLGAMHQNDNK